VDQLMDAVMALFLKRSGLAHIPFIWFWPDGATAATMLTHDVEGVEGLERCELMMDLDEEFGVRSAFQLVPEGQNDNLRGSAARLRARGFEVNLHDLNHDGRLFADHDEFVKRAERINGYAR